MRQLLLLLCGMGMIGSLNAQSISPEVIGSAGDQNTVGSTTVSWTIGEPLVETVATGGNEVSQGFHQPSYLLVALDNPFARHLAVEVFPNPTQERVFFEFEREDNSPIVIRLINLEGQLLEEQSSVELQDRLEFNLSQVPNGQYFLQVRTSSGEFNAYKVQKIN